MVLKIQEYIEEYIQVKMCKFLRSGENEIEHEFYSVMYAFKDKRPRVINSPE
jgi:hypothetical protein